MFSGLKRRVAELVPVRQRMSIQELLNPVGADDCTQSVTDTDLFESILYKSEDEK